MNVLYAAWGIGMSEALTPSWVLHSRKYRDTSLILDLLTGELGRVTVVSRGARSKGGRLASSLQPFRLFLASWRGKGELKTLTKTDFPAPPLQITGQSLMIGMYVNELLVRLLVRHDPLPQVVVGYGQLLTQLSIAKSTEVIEPALRRFELQLLEELGYGISFGIDAASGECVSPGQTYRFQPGTGFVATSESAGRYPGSTLLRIEAGDLDGDSARTARDVTRAAIDDLLGGKPLVSRQMYRSLKAQLG